MIKRILLIILILLLATLSLGIRIHHIPLESEKDIFAGSSGTQKSSGPDDVPSDFDEGKTGVLGPDDFSGIPLF